MNSTNFPLIRLSRFASALLILFGSAAGALAQAPTAVVDPPLDTPAAQQKAGKLVQGFFEAEVSLKIRPGRSKLMATKQDVVRVSITDPAILEFVQFSPRQFELIARRAGETTLTLWFGQGQDERILRYLVRVERDESTEDRQNLEYGRLQDQINELFPNSSIQLVPIADKLILQGQARDATEASRILAVVTGQSTDQDGNRLGPGVIGVAPTLPGADDLPASQVINLMRVPGEHQVLLKVRVAELTRTAARQMGADFAFQAGDLAFDSMLAAGGLPAAILSASSVQFRLEALASNGYSKILAEPNLVTLSGQPASFISGGEFAVPTVVGVDGVGAASTTFRGFGTQVNFLPVVLDKDKIRLTVSPSVSSINNANSVGGIPGLNTRGANTTVELREGQWLAIAGLIQDDQSGSKARIPFLGDIPGLDMIFSNKTVNRAETELVILVSPELIHPLEHDQVPLVLPGMDVNEPCDAHFYLWGDIEGNQGIHHRSTVYPLHRQNIERAAHRAHVEAKMGANFVESEQRYILGGPSGFSE